jgi:hypothetical protein
VAQPFRLCGNRAPSLLACRKPLRPEPRYEYTQFSVQPTRYGTGTYPVYLTTSTAGYPAGLGTTLRNETGEQATRRATDSRSHTTLVIPRIIFKVICWRCDSPNQPKVYAFRDYKESGRERNHETAF